MTRKRIQQLPAADDDRGTNDDGGGAVARAECHTISNSVGGANPSNVAVYHVYQLFTVDDVKALVAFIDPDDVRPAVDVQSRENAEIP